VGWGDLMALISAPRLFSSSSNMDGSVADRHRQAIYGRCDQPNEDGPVAKEDESSAWTAKPGCPLSVERIGSNTASGDDSSSDRVAAGEPGGADIPTMKHRSNASDSSREKSRSDVSWEGMSPGNSRNVANHLRLDLPNKPTFVHPYHRYDRNHDHVMQSLFLPLGSGRSPKQRRKLPATVTSMTKRLTLESSCRKNARSRETLRRNHQNYPTVCAGTICRHACLLMHR
jgi:hypothetical protein